MKVNAIITAGGTSSRFGNKNKLLEQINGCEVIKYTVDAFNYANVDEIIICANLSIMEDLKNLLECRAETNVILTGISLNDEICVLADEVSKIETLKFKVWE